MFYNVSKIKLTVLLLGHRVDTSVDYLDIDFAMEVVDTDQRYVVRMLVDLELRMVVSIDIDLDKALKESKRVVTVI